MPKWCNATVVAKKNWTDGLFTITIETKDVAHFQPGQFLHLALNGDDGKIINRPYSVASPHGERLDFFIVVVPDGKLTPRLWKLDVGDELMVSEKGVGRFTLEHSPVAPTLWLFATGTGLAPYIAMLRDRYVWDTYQRIVVSHGVRFAVDLGYQDEFNDFAIRYPERFRYLPSTTRERVDGILHGRIPTLVESGEIEAAARFELSASDSTVMLCGNPAMLDSMVEHLETRGLKEHRRKSPGQIVLERYW